MGSAKYAIFSVKNNFNVWGGKFLSANDINCISFKNCRHQFKKIIRYTNCFIYFILYHKQRRQLSTFRTKFKRLWNVSLDRCTCNTCEKHFDFVIIFQQGCLVLLYYLSTPLSFFSSFFFVFLFFFIQFRLCVAGC